MPDIRYTLVVLPATQFNRHRQEYPRGVTVWKHCLAHLEGELTSQQFNTWIRPLHAVEEGSFLRLLAPNHYVRDWVAQHLLERIRTVVDRSDPLRQMSPFRSEAGKPSLR